MKMKFKDVNWMLFGSFVMLIAMIVSLVFIYGYNDWDSAMTFCLSFGMVGFGIATFGFIYSSIRRHVELLERIEEYKKRYENL